MLSNIIQYFLTISLVMNNWSLQNNWCVATDYIKVCLIPAGHKNVYYSFGTFVNLL